jgi:predicted O-methyltransferase YrrM
MIRQFGQSVVSGQQAEAFAHEDLVLQTARGLAKELGLTAISAATGALLRVLAAAGGAKAVIEIGTGTGYSGLWLLRGMRPDGVLTTIDPEGEHQRIARRIFLEAGFPAMRSRVIAGRALEVLPRLSDGAYDMVVVDGEPAEAAACVEAAARLLRPGGSLVVIGAGRGTLAEDVRADEETWQSALLPSVDGVLAAVRR